MTAVRRYKFVLYALYIVLLITGIYLLWRNVEAAYFAGFALGLLTAPLLAEIRRNIFKDRGRDT